MQKVELKKKGIAEIKEKLKSVSIEPSEASSYLENLGSAPLQQKQKAVQLLMRPSVDLKGLTNHIDAVREVLAGYDAETIEQAEIQLKYDTYIEKEKEIAKRMGQLE